MVTILDRLISARRKPKPGAVQCGWATLATARSLEDGVREARIRALGGLMCATPNRLLQVICCYQMRQEIRQRSPEQVRRMERALGLEG